MLILSDGGAGAPVRRARGVCRRCLLWFFTRAHCGDSESDEGDIGGLSFLDKKRKTGYNLFAN